MVKERNTLYFFIKCPNRIHFLSSLEALLVLRARGGGGQGGGGGEGLRE